MTTNQTVIKQQIRAEDERRIVALARLEARRRRKWLKFWRVAFDVGLALVGAAIVVGLIVLILGKI